MRRKTVRTLLLPTALLATLLALEATVAGLRTPIDGAAPVLPAAFTPWRAATRPSTSAERRGDADAAVWVPPLLERTLTPSQRARDLAPDLREAILRMDGMFNAVAGSDPTESRIGWVPATLLHGSVPRRTTASYMEGVGPCEVYHRPTGRSGHSLSVLGRTACYAMMRGEPSELRGLEPSFFASAAGTAPVFAAPLPGARMSSSDFWAAQKRKVRDLEARLARGWHDRDGTLTAADLVR